jgi:hypothetical protein
MLTPEMLKIVTGNTNRLTMRFDRIVGLLERMNGIASNDDSQYAPEYQGRQLPRSVQRNLSGIICGSEFSVGDQIVVTDIARQNSTSAASLLSTSDVGTITCIRWPNSENCGQMVIQATFDGRNYHFRGDEVERY